MGKTKKSTMNVLENTLAKNQRLKTEAVTKMDDYFTICQYKTEEPKNIGAYIYIFIFRRGVQSPT